MIDLRVLIVEDNPANLLLARAMLERDGWRVTEARSADDARHVLRTTTPDLILMDVGLPGEDGLSLTRALKGAVATTAIPIIALTAHAMQRDRERALAAGCDGYLAKPFKAQDLRDAISAVVQAGRTRATTAETSGAP